MMAERARPKASDTSEPFWSATARGELLLQQDSATGRSQFFPRPVNLFGETPPQWKAAVGTGALIALTTARTPAPGFQPPFVVGLVQLDEGPRVFAPILNAPADLSPGRKMRICWQVAGDGPRLYAFEPA